MALLQTAPQDYARSREALEATRLVLAARRPAPRAEARAALTRWVEVNAFPAWAGTPWDFSGTTQTPGEGQIACGYYVSTVLSHAGVKVARAPLAQQASEFIVKTLASTVEDFRGTPAEAVQRVRARGEGLYVVGLDYHVGFLRVSGEQVDFCHSSYLGAKAVLCEPALTAPAFLSSRYVLGEALSDQVVDAWLAGRPVKTWKR